MNGLCAGIRVDLDLGEGKRMDGTLPYFLPLSLTNLSNETGPRKPLATPCRPGQLRSVMSSVQSRIRDWLRCS